MIKIKTSSQQPQPFCHSQPSHISKFDLYLCDLEASARGILSYA